MDQEQRTDHNPTHEAQGAQSVPTDQDTKPSETQRNEPFPEGGIQAWTVVFGC
jgi:hypothetical protein